MDRGNGEQGGKQDQIGIRRGKLQSFLGAEKYVLNYTIILELIRLPELIQLDFRMQEFDNSPSV